MCWKDFSTHRIPLALFIFPWSCQQHPVGKAPFLGGWRPFKTLHRFRKPGLYPSQSAGSLLSHWSIKLEGSNLIILFQKTEFLIFQASDCSTYSVKIRAERKQYSSILNHYKEPAKASSMRAVFSHIGIPVIRRILWINIRSCSVF